MDERSKIELRTQLANLRAAQRGLPVADRFALQPAINELKWRCAEPEAAAVMRIVQRRRAPIRGLYLEPLRQQA